MTETYEDQSGTREEDRQKQMRKTKATRRESKIEKQEKIRMNGLCTSSCQFINQSR